ncbi:MAG TPA: aldo/keto reductase [Patescibacteria group bacterium]|nr:aldo/keto reductase [Patescibacteria group bacterium]
MIHITHKEFKIPALGYGTWQMRDQECLTGVQKALEIGYRHIDTAQIYENEEQVGQAIKDSGIDRKEIFLTTKIWMSNVRDGALQKSLDVSLKKLKTDYVDLLLIHWPVKETPFKEQMDALQDVKNDGRTKLIGVSNFTVAQMTEVVEELGIELATNQVEYHPFLNQTPVYDFLTEHGMFLTAYSPLARGKINAEKDLAALAHKYGKTIGQIALRWLVQQEEVAAIPKAASEKHMRENFEIFDFTLDETDMKIIHALAHEGGRLINPDWAPSWDTHPEARA